MTEQGMQEPESLKSELERLRTIFADTAAIVPAEWKLTNTEDRIFRALLAVDCATREAIAEGAKVGLNRSIDVVIHRIRNKLTPFGVEIETVRSRGWRLVGRFTWQRSLAARAA